jgi:hypothetical protein
MQIQMRLMGVLIPSLLPFANNLRQHVDISAHLGGAISGTLAGLLIYKAWPRDNPLPRFMGFAQGFALVGLAVYLVAAYMPVRDYGRTSHLMGMLIPGGQLPKSNEEGASHSVELVIRYPHDPLTHYYRAIALSKTNHIEDAEKELRLALNEKEIIDSFFDKKFEFAIRGMLAGCLLDEKRFQEAKEIVVPICEGDPDGELAKILKKEGLCR